jgi:hypothetical protein
VMPVAERSPRLALGLYGLAAVLMVVASVGLSRIIGQPEGEETVIVIPIGTAQRLTAGEDVELIPTDLRFRLRDRLVVVNNDVSPHQVGPLVVAPGQRLETRFREAATVEGFCSLHASGQITIHVGGA